MLWYSIRLKEVTHLKRPWCWERLKAGGEGDDRGWDGWMASLTQWSWVWVNSRSWWWTARPGVLQSMGSQRVGHDWATELNWLTDWKEVLQWRGIDGKNRMIMLRGKTGYPNSLHWNRIPLKWYKGDTSKNTKDNKEAYYQWDRNLWDNSKRLRDVS